jgi:hypothetical protein
MQYNLATDERSANDDGSAPRAKTLRELGVPGELAREMEAAFRVLGATDGEKIVGFTLRTPDGAVWPLRQESCRETPTDRQQRSRVA